MKETVGSLRAYFLIISIFYLASLRPALEATHLIEKLFGFIGVFLTCSCFLVGIKLRYFLLKKIGFIYLILGIETILLAISLLTVLIFHGPNSTSIIVQAGLGSIILIYLFKTVNRLAEAEKIRLENPDPTLEKESGKIIGKATKVFLIFVFLLLLVAIGVPLISKLTH